MKGLKGATVSLLMEWSLFQLSQASEPQLQPGQDDVYNVSNCWSLFLIHHPDRPFGVLRGRELPAGQKNFG